jgi:tetratricopeptide (TPR) repeat protein
VPRPRRDGRGLQSPPEIAQPNLVAIKILAPERGGETRFAERFAREAELLAKLNHPHIVTIHDFGVTDSQLSTTDSQPLYYLVMEFVDGVNLRDLLRDGKLEAKQALAIVPPICEALQYAHDKGIVHRDIKPENLLLDRDGRIKIADFGIAALMGTDGDPSGTPPYMAPEQCGASPEVDSRADIYALGVVLYEMLTGERPNKELIAPSKKVHIDVRLDEIVLRALEKTPELRYQTAGEFRTVVETMAGSTSAAPIKPNLESVQNHCSRAAIVGACWAFAAVLHYLMPTLGYRMKSEFVPITMSILGLSAPIGTTILGWIAVWQIRRSAGRLHGLRLAVFDGLFFPLLLLVVAVAFALGLLISELEIGSPSRVSVGGLALLVCSPLCWFIMRRVWRKVNQSVAGPQNSEPSKSATSQPPAPETKPTRLGKWALGFFIGAVVSAPLLWGFMGAQEIIVLCGLALLLSFVMGLMSWRFNPGKFAALASGLGLLLLMGFTFNYLAPRPPAIKAALESERVKFSFSHTDALIGGHELTLPATRRMRWYPNTGQPLSLTNNRQVLTRVRLLEKHHANVFAEAACSVDGTNWESQILPLSANVTKGNMRFQNGTEVIVELLGTGIDGSNRPPSTAFGPVIERELRVDEETLVQGLNFESGKVLTLSLEEFNRKADDGTERVPNRSFGEWVEAKGIDMYAAAGDKGFGLGGSITEFKLSALPVAAWDTATETELKEALEHVVMEHDKFSNGLLIPAGAALPLTYALRSGDKLGLLQITARLQNPDGIKLRYKLVEDDVIDQVVPNIYGRELGDLKCFDFESNRFHTPPEALADELLSAVNRAQTKPPVEWHHVSPALIGWLDQTGVDVVAASIDSGAVLLSLGPGSARVVVMPLKPFYEEIDPSQAAFGHENLRFPENALTLERIANLGWSDAPISGYAGFFTREGNRGDVQITGITDDGFRDVKIRYKPLHNAPPVKPAPKKQYELSIQFGQNPDDPVVKTDVELGTQFGNFKKAGDRLFSINGQIDEAKNGKFPGSITLGDYNVSEAYKGTGHQGTIPVELELGKPFNHTVIVGIGFIRIITLNEKPASSEPSAGEPATSKTEAGDGAWMRAHVMASYGDLLCENRDLGGALTKYRAAKEVIEPLVRKEPANKERRNELTALYVKIGDVLQAQGDKAGALAAFRKAQEVDFPEFRTWEEHFIKSIGGLYNPTIPFKPEELKQLAANTESEADFRRLNWLILRAGAEKDDSFRHLLDQEELREDGDVNLALIAYDYSVNGNAKALDYLLASLAMEKTGSDSSVVVALAFVDEWDRIPKALKAHFVHSDGAGADLKFFCDLSKAYLFPRNSLKHEGKAGEGAPVPLGDKR